MRPWKDMVYGLTTKEEQQAFVDEVERRLASELGEGTSERLLKTLRGSSWSDEVASHWAESDSLIEELSGVQKALGRVLRHELPDFVRDPTVPSDPTWDPADYEDKLKRVKDAAEGYEAALRTLRESAEHLKRQLEGWKSIEQVPLIRSWQGRGEAVDDGVGLAADRLKRQLECEWMHMALLASALDGQVEEVIELGDLRRVANNLKQAASEARRVSKRRS